MKKLLVGAFALSMLAACNAGEDHQLNQEQTDALASGSTVTQRTCPSEDIRKEALANNPALRAQ